MTTPKFLYRYNGYEYLKVSKYPVIKETKCGYWVSTKGYEYSNRVDKDGNPIEPKKFCLKNSRKSFAYSTIEKARESFKKRKRKQIELLEVQLGRAKQALSRAEKGLFDDKAEWSTEDPFNWLEYIK